LPSNNDRDSIAAREDSHIIGTYLTFLLLASSEAAILGLGD
jgi:hypothetical protein